MQNTNLHDWTDEPVFIRVAADGQTVTVDFRGAVHRHKLSEDEVDICRTLPSIDLEIYRALPGERPAEAYRCRIGDVLRSKKSKLHEIIHKVWQSGTLVQDLVIR